MCCELPIITTDTPGAKELIKDNGYIIEAKYLESLEEKLNILIDNKSLRRKMGKNSRKITEKFSFDNIIKEYLNDWRKDD